MNLTKKLIKKYNHPDTLLVISAYPNKNTTHTGGGIASYTKNTLKAIKQADKNQKIIVLANITNKPETYTEGNILIIRCWQRNFPLIYFQFFLPVLKFNQVKDFLVEFEFAAYGELLITSFSPAFLGVNRLLNKNITTVIHQVVSNLTDLATHININSPQKLDLFNFLLRQYYKLLGATSNQVITLEQFLADRFNKITRSKKATSIPHGLFIKKTQPKRKAQTALNLSHNHYYLLAFGYLGFYKGTDLLIKAFQKPITVNGKSVKLILAGGESPTQGGKNHYKSFYNNLYNQINQNSNIIHTGFVSDKKIGIYHNAADITIFPYRTAMSASGPVSLALGYKKPLIVSRKLKHYSPLTTALNPNAIRKTIIQTLKNKKLLSQAAKHSQKLATARDFKYQGSQYLHLAKSDKNLQPKTLPSFNFAK